MDLFEDLKNAMTIIFKMTMDAHLNVFWMENGTVLLLSQHNAQKSAEMEFRLARKTAMTGMILIIEDVQKDARQDQNLVGNAQEEIQPRKWIVCQSAKMDW